MKRKMTMFVMALCLFAGSYAYADPPDNKKPHEWQKQQYEMEKERQQKEREFYKDDRKYREEMKKDDYGKRRDWDDDYDRKRHDREKHRYFTDDHRDYIQKNYVNRYHKRHCPPGLAKKKNGCLPPGQAKKWTMGKPLPRQVIFYDLPRDVRDHLGPPPPHHRFIRVAQDILLITVGTGMVIDAIEDLNWQFSR